MRSRIRLCLRDVGRGTLSSGTSKDTSLGVLFFSCNSGFASRALAAAYGPGLAFMSRAGMGEALGEIPGESLGLGVGPAPLWVRIPGEGLGRGGPDPALWASSKGVGGTTRGGVRVPVGDLIPGEVA